MTTKIARLEADLKDAEASREAERKQYVTLQHFNAVISPMQSQLAEMGRDIKQMLMLLTKRQGE